MRNPRALNTNKDKNFTFFRVHFYPLSDRRPLALFRPSRSPPRGEAGPPGQGPPQGTPPGAPRPPPPGTPPGPRDPPKGGSGGGTPQNRPKMAYFSPPTLRGGRATLEPGLVPSSHHEFCISALPLGVVKIRGKTLYPQTPPGGWIYTP